MKSYDDNWYIYLKDSKKDLVIENEINDDLNRKFIFVIRTLLFPKSRNYLMFYFLVLLKTQTP